MQTKFQGNVFYRLKENANSNDLIVYIHGLGDSGLVFERLILNSKLDEWNHLVPDLPGYGKSLWNDQEPLSLEEHAETMHNLVAKVRQKKQRVFLVGHSMGAVVCQFMLEAHPDAYAAFVNIEGNISVEDCMYSSKATVYSQNEFVEGGFEQLKATLFELSFSESALRQYFVSLNLCDPRAFYLNSEELVEISTTEQLAPRLEQLKQPTFYLFAKPNGISERSRMLLTACGIKTASVAKSGHWPFLDNEALFVTIFRKFLLAQNQAVENC